MKAHRMSMHTRAGSNPSHRLTRLRRLSFILTPAEHHDVCGDFLSVLGQVTNQPDGCRLGIFVVDVGDHCV